MAKPKDYRFNPLEYKTFSSIAFNAIGRASEVNNENALSLQHSTGNSGWSIGFVQTDFGQRKSEVDALLPLYQTWATKDKQFTATELASLSKRLKMSGQVGNSLSTSEKKSLNEFFRSDSGRAFIVSLDQKQIDKKWEHVGETLSKIPWLQELSNKDPKQAAKIVAMTSKLFNQNEVRGGRLVNQLKSNTFSAEQIRNWIGTDGIEGLNASAQSAILQGRNRALIGAELLSDLEMGTGQLSNAWHAEVHLAGNISLTSNFEKNTMVQVFDKMMRDPENGKVIFNKIESNLGDKSVLMSETTETSRVQLKNNILSVTGADHVVQSLVKDGWVNHNELVETIKRQELESNIAKLKTEKTDLTADINVVKGQKKVILELGEHLKSHSFDNLKDVQKLDALAKTAGIELVTPAEAILADKKTINYTNKADVTALQNVLFERGLITSPSRGIFGTQTKNALIKEFDLPQNHIFGNELGAEYLEKFNPKTIEAIQEKVDLALSKVQKNLTTLENKMIVIDQSITALEAKRVALNDPTIENSLETQQALKVADVESPELAFSKLQDDLVLKEMFIAELEQRIANLTALTAQVPDQQIENIEKPDLKIDLLEVENKEILLTMTATGMSFNINGKDHDASYFNQLQVGITDTQSTYRNENNTLLAKYEYESDQFSIFHKNPYTADKIAVISDFSEQNTINLVSFDAVKTQSLEKQKSLGKEC